MLDICRYNDYLWSMGKPVWRGRRAYGGIEEEAYLSLWVTADVLSRRLEKVLKAADVSPTQYNVLRILRGAPEGLPCHEIANRMITRDPDVTRLLDRMEKRGWVSRCRETKDRRMVMARITPAGAAVFERAGSAGDAGASGAVGAFGEEEVGGVDEVVGHGAEGRGGAGMDTGGRPHHGGIRDMACMAMIVTLAGGASPAPTTE